MSDVDRAIPTYIVTPGGMTLPRLDFYFICDKDEASPNYYGFMNKDSLWYILKETPSGATSTYRYVKGSSDYSTNWTNRASLSYDYFDNVF